jgi:hypothetical protein
MHVPMPQLSHWPAQAVSQHTPSTQKPESQVAGDAQVVPFGSAMAGAATSIEPASQMKASAGPGRMDST